MLEISHLAKSYPNGTVALTDINLRVESAQVIAIIGSSGAGKSTMIRCINRLVEPSSGKIILDEVDITSLNRKALRKMRRKLGMIFQEYNLVERLTVMENVLSGRLGYVSFWQALRRKFPKTDVKAAYELLDRVGLSERANSRADALSGGQRQRVGIARALMQDPDILLVDEPTASLDPKTSRQVMRLLCELAHERGTPALVNIHDVGLAREFADRVIGLGDGKVIFDGPPETLDERALDMIYGEEDWNATIETDEDDSALNVVAQAAS